MSKLAIVAAALVVCSAWAQGSGVKPQVKLETTLGDIVVELDGEAAPISTQNFLQYVEDKFYDGTIFHRVIPTFMIQGGGFTADMDEKKSGLRAPIKNEWQNGLKNKRGTIAMARTNVPDSATAQFYINVVDNPNLDKPDGKGAAYAVFGTVVSGMDVVDKIKAVPVQKHPKYPAPQAVTPVEAVVIKSATVVGSYDKKAISEAAAKKVTQASDPGSSKKAEPTREVAAALARSAAETGKSFQQTSSGLYYFVLEEGSGPSPKPTDTVSAKYTGWLLDGKEFDSSKSGPIDFPLNGVIKGWTEGVGMMKVGGKHRLIIPPDMAYGAQGRPPQIPGNSWLMFDVELVAIK